MAVENFETKKLCNCLYQHLWFYAKLARKANKYHIAHKVLSECLYSCELFSCKDIEKTSSVVFDLQIEKARVFWDEGLKEVAITSAKTLMDFYKETDSLLSDRYGKLLFLYGKWNAELSSQSPNFIIELYKQSTLFASECKSSYRFKAMAALATYSDHHYQTLRTKLSSPEWEAAEELRKKTLEEYQRCKSLALAPKITNDKQWLREQQELKRHTHFLKKQVESDTEEVNRLKLQLQLFLSLALQHYLGCLQNASKEFDPSVFRFISVWFDNTENDAVLSIIEDGLRGVPTFKFIPLLYQLVARVSCEKNSKFQNILQCLIAKICIDHPFHTTYIILSLSKSYENEKAAAALSILNHIRQHSKINSYVESISKLCEAYIELAKVETPKKTPRNKLLKISDRSQMLLNMDFHTVAVPTHPLPVSLNAQYENITGIHKFEETYFVVGGLTLPKIINCIGTNGIVYKQLVKGHDDLRQDAVMQQAFAVFNSILSSNKITRKRKLQVRTYVVLPLNQNCGVMEYVQNTIPLGEYLVGTTIKTPESPMSAHERYHPNDWLSSECRERMKKSEVVSQLETYRLITEHFKPVFRHFFYENYLQPSVWFHKRLAYTRSVAAWSMIGYVLGLGDRHIQNILIDCETAELVHIDFGIAFDQGKLLPYPELVPFRLTRDVVDGMGLPGVEGVFRRCCEETLRLLRNNHESLYTILEVFIHDPLHKWTISPKALSRQRHDRGFRENEAINYNQNSTTSTVNSKQGERVLYRLKEKLNGIEDGNSLSVQGHVNHLIQEAMSEDNLARLFCGWQAWV
ncbi:serine-protein kinase ATM-like isoform X2 [Zophobas morio]|uniref:serine-protein kinase ATM-like isoform X2 n=1 Tax=Zophobas morio TaxID=2755281 RepID=UPI003082A7D7